MDHTKLTFAGVMTAGLIALTGCGSDTTTQTPAPAPAGESPPTRYADTRFHYLIDAPGHMTANGDGTASFIGPSERLEIAVVTGSGAADLAALANQDSRALSASAFGFS